MKRKFSKECKIRYGHEIAINVTFSVFFITCILTFTLSQESDAEIDEEVDLLMSWYVLKESLDNALGSLPRS